MKTKNKSKIETTVDEKALIAALSVLREVRASVGRNYKSAIWYAWVDGNYYDRGLKRWESQLQNIRNTLGPSWLEAVRPVDFGKLPENGGIQ